VNSKNQNLIARRTSLKLIAEAVSDKWIRQLAFYHLLKFRFNNSCIFSFRSRMPEIAGMFNISVKTLYNYINSLKGKDLACDHATNLKLKTIRSFTSSRKKSIIYISNDNSLFDVTCLLYGKLLEQKARQQAFATSVRRCGRNDRVNDVPSVNAFRPSLSFRTIAKLLNCSEYKAFQVIQNLERLGVIETERQKPQRVSVNFTELGSIEDYPGYRFNINGQLFEIFGARVNFLQFPIYLRELSMRSYLKYTRH
jgi:hypothetical protein